MDRIIAPGLGLFLSLLLAVAPLLAVTGSKTPEGKMNTAASRGATNEICLTCNPLVGGAIAPKRAAIIPGEILPLIPIEHLGKIETPLP
jgi:hypothetical protein